MIGMILLCLVLILGKKRFNTLPLGFILMPVGLLLIMPSFYFMCRETDTFYWWGQFIGAIIILVGLFICVLIGFIRGFW